MIYIQILDYMWSPLDTEDIELEEIIAKNFVYDVKKSINTQKYKFAPLSPKYLRYKAKRGLSLNTWEATSQLKNSLTYTINNNNLITIGWDKNLRHKNSDLKVYQIAFLLEYGTMTIPPRPLFRSVLKEYSKNPSSYSKRLPKSDIFSPKRSKTKPNIIEAIKNSKLSKLGNKLKSILKKFKKR